MKLSDYLTEGKSKPTAIFVGRMSPPTVAHQKIIADALKKYFKVYIIIIEGYETSKLEKNFMTFQDRTELLKVTNRQAEAILARKGYIPEILSDNNIPTGDGIVVIAGSDRIDGYRKQFSDVDYDVKFEEIKRTDDDVSASKVRKAITDDDYKSYTRMIAPGLDNKKYFELFKRAMKVKNIEQLESKRNIKQEILMEAINRHMEHFEDSVFDGKDGIEQNIQIIGPILGTLSGESKAISTKFDGSPAIFFGPNPENGKFFVSTKGIFAKTPKVAYTDSDIDELFSPGAGKKLKEALKYLKQTNPTNIYQGDLMFTQGDKKRETIDGKQYITFTPNTITYAIPADSKLANEIAIAKIGIVVHTRYKGEIGNLSAVFDVHTDEFKNVSSVWLIDAFINDVSSINIDETEMKQIEGILKTIDDNKSVVEKIDDKVIELIRTYKNNRIKNGVGILKAEDGLKDFESYVETVLNAEMGKVTTDKARVSRDDKKKRIFEYIDNNSDNIILVFKIYNWFVKIKMIILRKLNQIEGMGTFLKQGDGYKVTAPEGFVAISNDGGVTKLVDRLEFSAANFNMPKNW